MKRTLTVKTTILAFLFLTLGTHFAYSTVVLHRNLTGLVDVSERIFRGICTSVQEGETQVGKGKLYYTEYTFEVTEVIKGEVSDQIIFRQYGLIKPRQFNGDLLMYQGVPLMPAYIEQSEYLLFLIGDSKYGLTSPVGLSQGAFSISRDQHGREVAVNGISNRGLFKDMDFDGTPAIQLSNRERRLVAKSKGPIDVGDFISVVKKVMSAPN